MFIGTSDTGMIARRYLLRERLGTGGMGEVYRATDRLTGKNLALKRVIVSPADLTFASKAEKGSSLLALATEFRTLSSLRHPNIISVLDYGFDDTHCPFFTMEYLPEAKTIIQAGRDKNQAEKLDLVLKTLQALVYLHRRSILHRDLKPGNLLVSKGELKVVDFGLSVETRTRSTMDASQTTAGTLAYMAPELFHGLAVSRASDLYAVGVIAYELLAGGHPFNTSNLAVMINEILNKKVDVYGSGMNPNLAAVIDGLLARDPADRPQDARQVIRDFCQAANLSLPEETEAIRESFLQAAKFVGRDAELSVLTEGLHSAIQGQGRSQLVSGESGVGKSRLLEELRTLALVKGAMVLRGQAVSEGGRVYQIWRDMLPILCILTEMDDTEAAILKPFVPNISDLLGREIPDPPPADPQATQTRLFALILKLFQHQTQPVVIILEDLQWAGSGSIGLLNYLNAQVARLSMFLIGSYRGDDTPRLPERIPGMPVLTLSRLDDPSIQELSASILGDTGRQPEVVDLLRRETEGIPFFLVELVRVLAERAGELGHIDQNFLPEKILPGGVEQIIERRLSRVPSEAYELLQLAAVIGRELDLGVLKNLSPTTDIEQWLTLGANAAVLEVQENRWRFSHDKLREHLLEELAPKARPIYHQRAAVGIEATYSDLTKHAAKLAYLWQVTGNEEKELRYAELAGQQELANSVYAEGIRFLERARDLLLKQEPSTQRSEHELRLLLLLGPALMNYHGQSSTEVTKAYSRAAELGQETRQVDTYFKVLWGLCANAFVGGKLTAAKLIVNRLYDTAEQSGSPLHRMEAAHAGWTTALWQGETRLAESYLQEGLPIYKSNHYHEACVALQGHDTAACGQALGTMNLWLFGYPEKAFQRADDGYQLTLEIRHPFSIAFGLLGKTLAYLFAGDVRQLENWAPELLKYSFKNKYNFFMTMSSIINGWWLARIGKVNDAISQMEQAEEVMLKGKTYSPRPLLVGTFMDVYRIAGLVEKGIHLFDQELQEHPLTGQRFFESEIRRLHGELLFLQGKSEEAESEFQLALDIARRQEARSLELRGGMSLARLWHDQKQEHEAYQLLSGIYNRFTEGFETADLLEARELLKTLS